MAYLIAGNEKRGFMAIVSCKDTPWVHYQEREHAESLAIYCDYLPDDCFKQCELPDRYQAMRLLSYKRPASKISRADQPKNYDLFLNKEG
jgi:hypothetical protein